MDRKLHRSGRHPEDIYWSSNPKYVNKAKIVGRQSSAVDSTIYRKLREEKEAIARRQEERAERLRKMRDANATDDLENLEAKLMDVHRAYGEYRRFPEKRRFRRAPVFGAVPDDENGVHEITTVGWQRLVRDAGILDNAVTATDMDALFTAVDAGRVGARMENKNWRDRREATGARFLDLRLDFDEFRVALRRAATVRYPEAKDESRAYAALLRNHVLARCARTRIAHDRDLDELLSRESMNEVTSRDVALRRVYGHYATLHMFSATTQKINWRTVVRLNATLNEDEFLMFLVNFEVVPHLMSKSEAMTVFRETEEANDADGRAGEMLYPAFVELVGRLAVQAFANVAPMLRNPATDVTSIVAVKKLVEPVPRELWTLGTVGALFRRRGYFLGPGGTDMLRRRTLVPGILLDRQEYGPGSRAANAGRMGRPGRERDGSVAWIPAGRSDDVRSPGPGGLKAAYGYQQSPSRVYLDAHEHTRESPVERARVERARLLKLEARSRFLARQLENDMRAAGLVVSPGAAERFVAARRASRDDEDAEDEDEAEAAAEARFLRESRRAHDGEEDDEWALAESHDRRAHLRAVTSAEARRGPAPPALRGHPWVPASSPSYDRCQPEKHNLTMQFHAKEGYDRQTHHPPRDRFPSIVADPNARGISNRRRTAKTTTFQPPVERAGYDRAVGGLVRVRGAGPRPKFAPAERRRDDDEDIERELKTLAVDRDEDENHAEGKDEEFHDGSHDDGFRPSPPRDGFDGGIPLIRSPGSRAPGSGSPKVAVAPGTYGYGLGTSFARPWEPKTGVSFGTREPTDAVPLRAEARRRPRDFPSVPHPAVAEVANLDWFEDVRSKAMRQRGLPSTRFLSVWGDKLGTKADRIRDEAHVAAVRKGLRGRAGGVDEYDDA